MQAEEINRFEPSKMENVGLTMAQNRFYSIPGIQSIIHLYEFQCFQGLFLKSVHPSFVYYNVGLTQVKIKFAITR